MKPYYSSPVYAPPADWNNFFVICSECQAAIPVSDVSRYDVWHEKFDTLFRALGERTQCPECFALVELINDTAHRIWHESLPEIENEFMELDESYSLLPAPPAPRYIVDP